MDDLLRKDADMAERSEAAEKIDPKQLQGPGSPDNRARNAPAAHAVFLGIAGEYRVGIIPDVGRQRWRPEGLSLGSNDAIRTVLFKLKAVAHID
jgi:hypothetical protein